MLTSERLDKLQGEIGQWSRENFDNQPSLNACLGVAEEVGELTHAYLKNTQGIRGTSDEHIAAMIDAVADALIYLCDAAERAKFPLNRARLVERSYKLQPAEALGYLHIAAGELVLAASSRPSMSGQPNPNGDVRPALFGAVLGGLCDAVYSLGLGMPYVGSLIDMTTPVWHKVRERNWKKNPMGGT